MKFHVEVTLKGTLDTPKGPFIKWCLEAIDNRYQGSEFCIDV